ncbi:MAG: aminotransferase class I/II-fold pyridoxal phosphate-dependent enzyme [Prevotella sp.]|nr:aminotransferase class I/II-fold pyridoxal phosphate-dependent enzyme [Prevotella sp.]
MIQGHGDDTYLYPDVRVNFSSNIFGGADMSGLKEYLRRHIDVIDNYPEPDALSLREAIARRSDIDAGCVLVTNGATEAIYLVAQALRHAGFTRYHVEQPTFSEYADACRMVGMEPSEQAVDGCVSWLCTPNNPTGRVTPIGELPSHGVLVLDQSYEDYTLSQVLTPRQAVLRKDVWQIHSLTKTYAVPGLRIGYVVSSRENIALLQQFARPWSVNALAIVAGRWLLDTDSRAVTDVQALLCEARRLNRELNLVSGITAFPTETNFMLARIEAHSSAALKDYLAREHGLLIRDASNFAGLDQHYFRVSAQQPNENDLLVAAIRSFVKR